MWRFRNYFRINPNKKIEIDFGGLEPRVQQIVNSFISLFVNDDAQMLRFRSFILGYQENLVEERRDTIEGQIVTAIYSLVNRGIEYISSKEIIAEGEILDWKGVQIKPRSLNKYLKTLGFGKTELMRTDEGVKRCIKLEKTNLRYLFNRFGCNDVTKVTVTMGRASKFNKNPDNFFDAKNVTIQRLTPSTVTTVTNVTNIEEELVSNEPEIIHHKCSICGSEPSVGESKTGKPLCELCIKHKDAL